MLSQLHLGKLSVQDLPSANFHTSLALTLQLAPPARIAVVDSYFALDVYCLPTQLESSEGEPALIYPPSNDAPLRAKLAKVEQTRNGKLGFVV